MKQIQIEEPVQELKKHIRPMTRLPSQSLRNPGMLCRIRFRMEWKVETMSN